MKTILAIYIASCIASAGEIQATIDNIGELKGKLYVGLYNKKDGHGDTERYFKKHIKDATRGQISVSFKNIPNGVYAVAVFQDKNGNKRLDTNILGLPKEPYGFSENIFHSLRATTFDEAKFTLDSTKKIILHLKN